ncbi:hypothetical protein [Haloarchaeobius litoreus]|uniref:Integral membrane protein n=1 Tax=Haloarchaeobius litoreus TaxID=755306 RepID=A0ABD6DK03_9EURY|nr:hypothetical protein [Haloarchaeobius litoreus]
MQNEETLETPTDSDTEPESEEQALREELYDQCDVSRSTQIGIKYILPLLEGVVDTDHYDTDTRSKILAEIALFQAYTDVPKFKMFVWAAFLLGSYDLLHPLNPGIYSVIFLALVTINGFVSSLRSPSMMAAELEGATDEDGMPADYRAKAYTSVNTNVSIVLFVFAVGIQILVTGGFVEGELITRNIAEGDVPSIGTAIVLLFLPVIWRRIRRDD